MKNIVEVNENYKPGDKTKELEADASDLSSGIAAFAAITGAVILLSPKLRKKFKGMNSIFDVIKIFKIL